MGQTINAVKNQKFTLTEEIFRQINYLVISLVKTLVSRNFCQKSGKKLAEKEFRQIHYLVALF